MIRTLLYHLVPFLLPFIAYALFVLATRRARANGALFEDAPWYWLFVSGLVLAAISILVYWYVIQQPAGGAYIPPHVKNGTVVPGRVVHD